MGFSRASSADPRGKRAPRAALVLSLLLASLFASAPTAAGRERFDIDLFARVGDPGQPEGIAIDGDRRVFVGTSPKEGGPTGARRRSKVFAYDRGGELKRDYLIRGQDLDDPFYGLVGMAFDGEDLLYAADVAPARVVRLNPRTGAQRDYATFRDVPPCDAVGRSRNCSDTVTDMAPLPDYPVFARDGTMYVTDLAQALIWRIPPGGGRPKVWFTDQGFESVFGPNGIQFMADGETLLFVLSTQSSPAADPQRSAGLYELEIKPNGDPGRLRQFWESGFADVPDGFAIARSGNVYVALAGTPFGNAVAVVSPAGEEIARTPASPAENQQMEVPFDQPASAAFLGRRVLVTNHALFSRNPDHYAVLDVFAAERGLPLLRPAVDRLVGGNGARCRGERASIAGTAGDEELVGTDDRDVVVGRAGDDTIRGRGGNDVLCANRGDDRVRGNGGTDRMSGNGGADRLAGRAGGDRGKGGRGDDRLKGGGGGDALRGNPGDDRIVGGGGSDRCRGDGGDDHASSCEVAGRFP